MTVLVQLSFPVAVLNEDDVVTVDDDDSDDDDESVLLADLTPGEKVSLLVVEVVLSVKVGKKVKLALLEVDVEFVKVVVGAVVLELSVELLENKDAVEVNESL